MKRYDIHRRFEEVSLTLAMHNAMANDPELERTPEGRAEYQRLKSEHAQLIAAIKAETN